MENLDPPPPPPTPQTIKIGKMVRFCPSRGFILDLVGWGKGGGGEGRGGNGGLLFHLILAKIVAKDVLCRITITYRPISRKSR